MESRAIFTVHMIKIIIGRGDGGGGEGGGWDDDLLVGRRLSPSHEKSFISLSRRTNTLRNSHLSLPAKPFWNFLIQIKTKIGLTPGLNGGAEM